MIDEEVVEEVETTLDGSSPAEKYLESLLKRHHGDGSITELIIQAEIMLELKRIRKY